MGEAASSSDLLWLRTAVGKLEFVEVVYEHPRQLLLLDVRELSLEHRFWWCSDVWFMSSFFSVSSSMSFDVVRIVIQNSEHFGDDVYA